MQILKDFTPTWIKNVRKKSPTIIIILFLWDPGNQSRKGLYSVFVLARLAPQLFAFVKTPNQILPVKHVCSPAALSELFKIKLKHTLLFSLSY